LQPIATHRAPSRPIAPHCNPSRPHCNPLHQSRDTTQSHRNHNNPSSMSYFQHMLMHSFIFFSFFKHIKREKLNINNDIIYDVIIYWKITHVITSHRSRDTAQPIASVTRHRATHRISHATPRKPIASVTRHRARINPSSMSSFQHGSICSFIFFHYLNLSNERNYSINNHI
jgi:hypothetical protein